MLEEWKRKWGGASAAPGGGRYIVYLLAVAVCLGLLAFIWPSAETGPRPDTPSAAGQETGVNQARIALAADLERILSQINGAGKVQVSITLSSDGLRSYARNTQSDHRVTRETDSAGGDREVSEENESSDLAISGGSALLVEDNAPQVVGVLVVAEGAANNLVKEKLTAAVTVLLNVSPHQVRVETREGNRQ